MKHMAEIRNDNGISTLYVNPFRHLQARYIIPLRMIRKGWK